MFELRANQDGRISKKTRVAKKINPKALANENQECRTWLDWSKLVSYRGEPLSERIVKIPNERGKAGASIAILIGLGMRPGFQDYLVMAPSVGRSGRLYGGLLLEMKTADGGRVDSDQVKWRDKAIRFGYHAEICSGGIAMIEATKAYFEFIGAVASGAFHDRTRI
jgi:hypothetical protein